MRPSRLALLTLALGGLAACAPPPSTGPSASAGGAFIPDTPTDYGPGDYCANTVVYLQAEARANFSLGSEYYRNGEYCAAYPYMKWLLANDALFTGEEPDDRNYLRMASIYEAFAAEVDSTDRAERKAYLDSALAARRMGVEAMDARGIAYDGYLRDLREGFFYFTNADYYDDSDERQFAAFNRALDAKPDSLEDWYLVQLFNASALEYGDEQPNPERAEFIRKIAAVVDDPALRTGYTQYADYIATAQQGPQVAGTDEAVQSLIDRLEGGTLSGNDVLVLFATATRQPERVEALGADPDEVISGLTRLPEIESQVNNPTTLYALSVRARREGDSARAADLFNRAIQNAESNAQRADFYYSAGQYDRALQVFPQHGPSLYRRAGQIASAVGRPSSTRGRIAYWCLADIYRNVAAQTSGSIAANARRAAAQYERAGPNREQTFLDLGLSPGQSVSSSLGAYGSCTTRVR